MGLFFVLIFCFEPKNEKEKGLLTMAVKALLIDLSGTIHIESKAIPGAAEAIHKLRASKIPFR